MDELKVLITREQIAARIAEMGVKIAADSAGEAVIFVAVLKGAAIFLSDLVRQVQVDATFEFIGVSSYGNRVEAQQPDSQQPDPPPTRRAWDSTGEVRVTKDVDQSLRGANVILVEDILDTGLTLTFLKRHLLAHEPKSLRVAVLLDKPPRRRSSVEAEYVGFTIPDEFVVGYGLDYAERYRNLPDGCVLPGGA